MGRVFSWPRTLAAQFEQFLPSTLKAYCGCSECLRGRRHLPWLEGFKFKGGSEDRFFQDMTIMPRIFHDTPFAAACLQVASKRKRSILASESMYHTTHHYVSVLNMRSRKSSLEDKIRSVSGTFSRNNQRLPQYPISSLWDLRKFLFEWLSQPIQEGRAKASPRKKKKKKKKKKSKKKIDE